MYYSDKAKEVTEKIVERFESGDIAEPLARVAINFASGVPMSKWSWSNQFLAALANATDARGHRQWQKVGRKVVDWKKSIYILVPKKRKVKVPKDATEEEKKKLSGYYIYGYKTVAVFDVSNTSGDPLPEHARETEFLNSLPLIETAKKLGVDTSLFNTGENSYLGSYSTVTDKIQLGVQNESVWAHELIHFADNKLGNLKEQGQHYLSETVAELGGNVLLTAIGKEVEADIGGTWNYINSYARANNIEPISAIKEAIGRVISAVSFVLENAAENNEVVIA